MTHRLDADEYFIHRVQLHCAERGFSFFLVEPLWVEAFLAHLEQGEVGAKVLLNMHSEHHLPEEIYHRLVRRAHDLGTQVIDPPDVALAAFDKARLHPQLIEAGFAVPPTVVVRGNTLGTFRLTDVDRAALGTPFVVKPALGYGRRGVIADAQDERDLERSARAWPGTDYLLQRRIVPARRGGEPEYFRVFFAFEATWLCWWNCDTDRYRAVTPAEEAELGLAVLRDVATGLARLTGMRFFSTEVTRTEAGAWVLIDYVNDQCHMLCQSAHPQIGVPDAVVAGIARRLVEGAAAWIRPGATRGGPP